MSLAYRRKAFYYILRNLIKAGNIFHAPLTKRCWHHVAKHRPGRGDCEQNFVDFRARPHM